MDRPPNKISGKTFKGMLSPKGYLPKQTHQTLRRLGKSSLLHRGVTRGVTKQEALKTIKLLKKEGIKVSKNRYDRPLQIYRRATQKMAKDLDKDLLQEKRALKLQHRQAETRQRKLEEISALAAEQKKLIEEEKRKKKMAAYRSLEYSDELRQEEEGKSSIEYDPRSVLGQSLSEQLEEKRVGPEKQSSWKKENKKSSNRPKKINRQKPSLVDIDKLPDLNIG
ncbi:hypothetical protein HYZ76_02005 [Candidatus Falkowbacteria bacterium]|nr:hypothetical protein [Candidatus Falkowbacteria bacterium]